MDSESVKEKYCSTREAAKMLGISLTTAQVMVEEGHLKAWKTAGGHRRISVESVKSMLQNRESGGALSANSGDEYTVLIAEDDEALCKLYVRTFSSWKLPIKLVTVNNGMEAMVLVERMRPSLLILDLGMPRMNGFEFVKTIKSDDRYRRLPVIIVSYKDRPEDRMRGLEAGANYYLTKSSFHQNFTESDLMKRKKIFFKN